MKWKQYEVYANRVKVGELAARCLSQARSDAWMRMGAKLRGQVDVKLKGDCQCTRCLKGGKC